MPQRRAELQRRLRNLWFQLWLRSWRRATFQGVESVGLSRAHGDWSWGLDSEARLLIIPDGEMIEVFQISKFYEFWRDVHTKDISLGELRHLPAKHGAKPARTRTLKDAITSARGSQACHHQGQRSGISSKTSTSGKTLTIRSHLHE